MLAFPFELSTPLAQGSNTARVNKNTVRLVSGGVEGTYVQIASNLTQALDEKYQFRVIPIIGKGSKTNIEDLLFLQGVDLAIVQSDVLDFFGRDSDDKIPGIERKLLYITKLYNEEVHIIAGPNIRSIRGLSGKKVAYGPEGGGSAMTAENIFDFLGIQVDFTEYPYRRALRELLTGNIAALVHVVGKTLDDYEKILPEAGLHLLSLPVDLFDEPYQPATFSREEYPSPGQTLANGFRYDLEPDRCEIDRKAPGSAGIDGPLAQFPEVGKDMLGGFHDGHLLFGEVDFKSSRDASTVDLILDGTCHRIDLRLQPDFHRLGAPLKWHVSTMNSMRWLR